MFVNGVKIATEQKGKRNCDIQVEENGFEASLAILADSKRLPGSFGSQTQFPCKMEHVMGTNIVSQNTSVLTSWKDIARYMGKGVRTVQRWEMDFGLPVRRPQGSNKKAVLARPSDLDAWVALRCRSRAEMQPMPAANANHQLCSRTVLEAQIETARQLREHNLMLLNEVRSQLEKLRKQILELHAGE